jgi:hypothetical protein
LKQIVKRDVHVVFAPIGKGGECHRDGQDDQRKRIKEDGEDSPAFHTFFNSAMKSNTVPDKSAREYNFAE